MTALRRSTPFLVLLALLGALSAACGPDAPPPADPCQAATYSAPMCQQAVAAHGYYWYGMWHPMMYPYPLGYYNHASVIYISRGGRIAPVGGTYYSRSYVSPATSRSGFGSSVNSSSGTARGGFGATGAARASAGASSFGG